MLTISGLPCGIRYAPALVPGSAGAESGVSRGLVQLHPWPTRARNDRNERFRRAMFPVATAPLLLAAVFITGEPALLTASLENSLSKLV
jgi:hypothetical protein